MSYVARVATRYVLGEPQMEQSDSDKARSGSRKVLGDTAITVAERIVSQVAQFTIFIVAARILGPAEFGVFALASAIAILLLRVAEVGWAPFIMSISGDDTVPRQVLLIAILAGLTVGSVGILGALVAAEFGVGSDIVTLMILFAFWVMLATASSAQKGVMIWLNRMKSSAICEISGEIVGLVVAVSSLLSGWGLLSLAFGRLSFQTTHLCMSFAITRLSPKAGMRKELMRELWVFSGQIFVSRMLINIRLYTATFIIGGFLGPLAVGFFRAADRLVSAAGEVIAVPGQLLAWTLLRRARDDGDAEGMTERINAQVRYHFKVLVVAGTPVFIWLMVMSEELIGGLLSEEWAPAAPLVVILALSRMLFIFGILTEPLLSIVGQAKRLPAFTLTVLILSVSLTFWSVHFGVYAVAWAQVLIAVLVMGATVWLFRAYAGIQWRRVATELSGTILPLSIGVVTLRLLDYVSADYGLPDLVEVVGFGIVAIVVYAISIRLFDRPFWQRLTAGLGKGSLS